MLIDDLVLYGKTDKAAFTMPDGTKLYDYYTAGEAITLPAAMEFEPYCGKTKTAVALRKDGKDYSFDENMSPIAEPVEIYRVPKSCYIDMGDLL